MNFNVKLANETEKVDKVLTYFVKEIENPMKLKSEFPNIWELMLDCSVLLEE